MNDIEDIRENFKKPSAGFKPFVRWWWFGTATKQEIEREMHEMEEKGFGGVEIQSIYCALDGGNVTDHEKIEWLSDEWLDMISVAVETGKETGLQVDMTFGSGWPFGGPHVPPEKASKRLGGHSTPLMEGERLEIKVDELHQEPERIVCVCAVKDAAAGMKPENIMMLDTFIQNGVLSWDVPDGNWHLFWFFVENTNQRVKRAAPGGEGPVLDHLSRDALDLHASTIITALRHAFGRDLGEAFGSFFCDSWEVYGEDWTDTFLASFQREFKYDLKPFLPILRASMVQGYQKTSLDELIIYDYKKHHADLILQEFFSSFVARCHDAGVKCRVQPYSAPTDLLNAYGLLDILEIEGFGQHGIGTMYYGSVDPRLASSGAHVYGKDMVSCESFTWLREHFCATLEELKHEADQIIMHGVNRVIYHGYPYSPPCAGIPGWVFYASIMANHNNTWWPYVHLLNACIARNAMLSVQGRHVARFAIYIPYHDEWSKNNGILKELRVALKSNGHVSDYDYVNDERILNAASIVDGQLEIGHGKYGALVFFKTELVPVETAMKVCDLAERGLPVIVVGEPPARAPGYKASIEGTSNEPARLFARAGDRIHRIELMARLNETLEQHGIAPSVRVERSDPESTSIQFLHREMGNCNLFFVINDSTGYTDADVYFKAKGVVERWNPEHGTTEAACGTFKDGYTSIGPQRFAPHEAGWFVIHEDADVKVSGTSARHHEMKAILDINGPWNIEFNWQENQFPREHGHRTVKKTVHLHDWTREADTRYFSGTATYETCFSLNDLPTGEPSRLFLSLGEVHEIADVTVNGRHAGVAWHDERIMDVTGFIKEGENVLNIRVTNLLTNKVIGFDRNNTPWKPDYYFVNMQYKPFTCDAMQPKPSGLLGPVQVLVAR